MVKGFKNSDLGIIPNDWNIAILGEFASISGRVGWKGYTKKDLRNVGPYAIGAKHIDKSNRLDLSQPTHLSLEKYFESPEIMVFKDDILIVQRGSIGKVVLIEREIGKATINPSMVILRLKRNSPSYIYHYLVSRSGQSQIILDTSFTGVPMITQKQVSGFKVPLPPTLAEQDAIARALNDTDALIIGLEKLIAKKFAIKQGVMQELLKPKYDWKEQTLGEIATLKARIGWQGLTTAEYRKTGNYYLITGTEFKDGSIDWERCFYVDEERYRQDKNIQIKENDILVTKDGTVGKVAFIKTIPKPATLNSGVFVIRPTTNSFYSEFFYYLLRSEVFSIFLSQLSAGSTINHLYQKDFVTFKFHAPIKLNEQKRIANVLSDIDLEIQELSKKLTKYKLLKQGLLQNLLTGKIRLI